MSYDASKIRILEGLEAVRVNPGMYIGDTDKGGLHHLIWEILDNSIDEAMAGYCEKISVTIEEDGKTISVEDYGRGIPVDLHPTEKISALQVVFTKLHAGGKFGGEGSMYEASGGLHGVGASCVNALSEYLMVEVCREGFVWSQEYSEGKPKHKVKKLNAIGKRDKQHGTKVTWRADSKIFKSGTKFDDKIIIRRLREMAFLNRGLLISFYNKQTNHQENFEFTGGIVDYLKYLSEGKTNIFPEEPIYVESKCDLTTRPGKQAIVQIALSYSYDDDESVFSYVNNITTPDGGTHVSGFKNALTRVVNIFARNLKLLKDSAPNLNGDDVREGITAIVSIRWPRPEFVSQNKTKLGSVEAESVVSNLTLSLLTGFFDKNTAIVKKIVEKAIVSQEARTAAKKQSEIIKRKGFLGKSNRLPGKLYDCSSEKSSLSELLIVEGNSAAGSAKDGRDPQYQAILPIRGKIINAEKKGMEDLLKNKEIQSLISVIGTGIKDNFNIDKLRYDKVIIMADADDDGCHISTLLLTFFWKYMRPLVLNGHVYLAQPPLYCVETGKVKNYCWNDKEMQDAIKKHSTYKVVRFKGLGEMDAEQLAETTMNIQTRRLINLQVSDPAECEHIVSVLMGSDVQLRKEHITNQVNSIISE